MKVNRNTGKTAEKKKKGFLGRLLEKIDKNMEEKSKKSSCCDGGNNNKKSSCC